MTVVNADTILSNFEQSVLLHRYLAILHAAPPIEASNSSNSGSSGESSSDAPQPGPGTSGGSGNSSRTTHINSGMSGISNANGSNSTPGNGLSNGTAGGSGGTMPGGAATSAGSSAGSSRFRMETNFYVLATACLMLANKSLRARMGSARPRRREELLRTAYSVQFRGRSVEKGTAEAAKWEAKLAAAEREVLIALGFDLHITDPLEALHVQRKQQVSAPLAV